MLDSSFSFDTNQNNDSYNLVLKRCSTWESASKKVLIVFQTVDGRDLKLGELLSNRGSGTAIRNSIKYSRKLARDYKDTNLDNIAYCTANFHNRKSLHLKGAARHEADKEFSQRIINLIKKIKPTHILISGDQAMNAIFPQVEHSSYKRGWVHELSVGKLEVKVTSTLDFSRLVEKGGEHANLLGFWCRHFSYLLLGKNPHDISQIKATPRYIDTIEKFDILMQRFDSSEICAVDTETKNLSVLHNKIYTIQFCTNHNEEVGYVLSVDHPLCHWSVADRKYIKTELRRRFMAKTGPTLVMFNGMFDLRIIRRALKIPIIWLPLWEITFAEHLLDENISELASQGTKPGGLRAMYCSYGNDFYFQDSSFQKEDRATTGTVDPRSKDFLSYASTDVVSLLAIRKQQIARSAYMVIEGEGYKPYFLRHMMYQMSDTAHQLSHLREDGSKIERNYLKQLLSSDSPLKKELDKTKNAFKLFKEVQATNKLLLADSGFKTNALFESTSPPWIFGLNKAAHKKKLFIETLGLEALAKTKTGEDQIDSAFINHYKDKNKVVSLYGDYQKLSKLLSTYVKGWYVKLKNDIDSAIDDHLRAEYSVWDVVTGRLASKRPNLQNIVSRGKLAKIIKRMFVASKGSLLIRYDYSAHEVRVWAIIANDKVLAEAFKSGQRLRQAFIQDPSEENLKAIKIKGDIHIQNTYRFFGKLVEKDDPLRDAVKSVIFGTLYGKSVNSLGEDTKKGDLSKLKEEISLLYEESQYLLSLSNEDV